MDFLFNNVGWILAAAIVVFGLLVIGLKDVLRLFNGGLTRIWAISSVCFAESIRRRVLLITPLAIVGVVIVSQLQKPLDEQDAIRQTIKFCIFATALVVTTAIIILACTNLPREIENRVIYTVVTKPTTRLELVIGKVVGFARVSATILLIMGLFSYAYLHARAWTFRQQIQKRLDAGLVSNETTRATMQHVLQPGGLLEAKHFVEPSGISVFARLPQPGETIRWLRSPNEQLALVPFALSPADVTQNGMVTPLVLRVHVGFELTPLTPEERTEFGLPQEGEESSDGNRPSAPATRPAAPPAAPPPAGPQMMSAMQLLPGAQRQGSSTTAPASPLSEAAAAAAAAAAPVTQPTAESESEQLLRALLDPNRPVNISISILDPDFYQLIGSQALNDGKPISIPKDGSPVEVTLNPQMVARLAEQRGFYVQISVMTRASEIWIDSRMDDANLAVYFVPVNAPPGVVIPPLRDSATGTYAPMIFQGRSGRLGQQLRGGPGERVPVALFHFDKGTPIYTDAQGNIQFRFRAGIERSLAEIAEEDEATVATLALHDPATGTVSQPQTQVTLESKRAVYISLPAGDLVQNGVAARPFDVLLRGLTRGHYLEITSDSLQLTGQEQPFGWNLFKSLAVLWLLTVLVIIVSIFCSTFLSWPIAVVLTLVVLLGRWGVDQLGENATSGIGRAIVQDMFPRADTAQARVISESVEALTRVLKVVVAVLPDISQFSVTEQIEHGQTVPAAALGRAGVVILTYGLPMMVLAFVFLKNKEVAP